MVFRSRGDRLNGSSTFLQGLVTSLDITGQMALLVLAGYVMVRRNWLGSGTLSDLTRFLIDAVIPCAFILAMTRSFSFQLLHHGLVLATVVTAWIVLSWMFSGVLFRFFPGDSPSRDRSVTAMMMISNSLYLPLPVILAVTPQSLHDQAIVYISIAALPSIIIMWTAGVILLGGSNRPKGGARIRLMFNAPILSLFFGILLSLIPGVREAATAMPGSLFPLRMVFSAMDFLSRLLSPMAMLILGGMIASSRGRGKVPLRYSVPLICVRLLLVPAAVCLLIRSGLTGLPALASTVLILVAAAPPATNHALIARKYHGEWELVSSLQLITHIAALLTIPFWLSIGLGFQN